MPSPRDLDGGLTAQHVDGYVTLIVPPPSPMPNGDLIPPSPHLIGARDTATGQLHCGILGLHLRSVIAPGALEITVDLDEITRPDGTPAITLDQASAAAQHHFRRVADWPQGVPTARSRYRVDGFELGTAPRDPYVDGEQLLRDVRDVKRALGLPGDEGDPR